MRSAPLITSGSGNLADLWCWQRAYYAIRLLLQNGLQVKVLSGGMQTYQARMMAREY